MARLQLRHRRAPRRSSAAVYGRAGIQVRSQRAVAACPNEDVLLSFNERRLPAESAEQVKEHLVGCADCRIIVSELARGDSPEPETPRPLARGSSLGRYLVLEQVGSGGMGVVYAAYDPNLDRRVAVKLLRDAGGEKQRARLVQEARAMACLLYTSRCV